MDPALGIDFGTTTSSMAWVNPATGQAEILKNAEGEEKTPSVVWFGKDEVLVGRAAAEMLEDDRVARGVFVSVKRDLNATRVLPGRGIVKAVDAVAAILAKLKTDAEEYHFHEAVGKAVLTHPAAFDPMERDIVAEAGRKAGFAEVTLLEEPVAAGLAYARAGLAPGRTILVYDLGGGTFDLAVLEADEDAPSGYRLALPPRGLRQCGGDDFDRQLYAWIEEQAIESLGRPFDEHGFHPRLLRLVRQRKEALTSQSRVSFNAYFNEGRPHFECTIERPVFERLIGELVARTARETATMLAEATARSLAVETVALIGGSARVPAVARTLAEILPLTPKKWQHQDVAVALGAAYRAAPPFPARTASPAGRSRGAEPSAENQPRPEAEAGKAAVSIRRGFRPGEVFRDGPNYPELVVIPAGRFVMGSPASEEGRYSDEGPQHEVVIAKPFALGRYAVTFAEWDVFAVETNGYRPSDAGWGRGRLPVINVSWNDARAYVTWLAKKTGETYRLPSEAKWEYACRAGTTTPFWWGESFEVDKANCATSFFKAFSNKPVPVDSFAPNPFGLYNTHGNARELVEDAWHNNYTGAPTDGSPWTTGDSASRVLRGGFWVCFPRSLRSALRSNFTADFRNNDIGFRVARTLIP